MKSNGKVQNWEVYQTGDLNQSTVLELELPVALGANLTPDSGRALKIE